jgi:hypothetical protein
MLPHTWQQQVVLTPVGLDLLALVDDLQGGVAADLAATAGRQNHVGKQHA